MKDLRFNHIVWGFLALLALAVILIVLIGNRAGVVVNTVYPSAAGPVSPWVRIGVDFGQTMARVQTEKALQFTPAVTGNLSWSGNTLWLTPTKPLQAGVLYTASLATSAQGTDGRKLSKMLVWTFTTRAASIIYFSPAQKGSEIWLNDPGQAAPRQLTTTNNAVEDFVADRDGGSIAYSVSNSQGGIDLWLMDRDGANQRLLVTCGIDPCSMPAWSPGGDRIAFSRQTRKGGANSALNPPRVWTAGVLTGQPAPLIQDPSIEGENPSWSPDGSYLAFYDAAHASLHVLNLQTSQDSLIPSQHDDKVAWAPDGSRLLFANVLSTGEQSYLGIFQVDLSNLQVTEPFKDVLAGVDAALPAWSPDGKWVVTGLRSLQGGDSNQLWVLGFNHEAPIQVTSDQVYTHAGYQWNTGGNMIVFQRFELGRSDSQPEILTWNKDTGQTQMIAQNADLAEWLP